MTKTDYILSFCDILVDNLHNEHYIREDDDLAIYSFYMGMYHNFTCSICSLYNKYNEYKSMIIEYTNMRLIECHIPITIDTHIIRCEYWPTKEVFVEYMNKYHMPSSRYSMDYILKEGY